MTIELEPEYATVGGLVLAPGWIPEVSRWLRPGDFARPAPRLTYELVLTMQARGESVDPVTVLARMRSGGLLRSDGYPGNELIRMIESVPAPVSTGYYGRLVLAASIARGTQQIGERLVQAGSRPRDPADLFVIVADQVQALEAVRRRWGVATGEQIPMLEAPRSREPVVLGEAIAELDTVGRRGELAS